MFATYSHWARGQAAPSITTQPQSTSAIVGTNVAFTVTATGQATLVYQWFFNGVAITNSSRISGVASNTLVLNGVVTNDAGNYFMIVSNRHAVVTSSTATLTVTPPPPGVPSISSFSPISGVVGTTITLIGENFHKIPASNTVWFGAVRADVLSAETNILEVTVPSGATYAPITVTANGLSAYSQTAFEPTFFGSGQPVSATTFAPRQDLAIGMRCIATAIVDMDGDGKPDLVMDDIEGGGLICLLRNIGTNGSLSTGSFAPRVTFPSFRAPSPNAYGMIAADVDGDGKPDVIYVDSGNNRIGVYRNVSVAGSLTTNSLAAPVFFSVGASPPYVRARDIDGDGRIDLVSCNRDGTISILRNIGNAGSISFAPKVNFFSGTDAFDVVIQDFDGDGKPDLAVAHLETTFISVFRNTSVPGDITTNSLAPKVELPSLGGLFTIFAGDVDGDGKAELLAGGKSSTLSVYRNLASTGSLTTNSFAAPVNFGNPGWLQNIALSDINGDGKADIITEGQLNSYLAIYQNQSTPGSFTNTFLAGRVDYSAGYNAVGLSVGDLDGDGRADVVFYNHYDNTLSIYQNITPFASPPVITSQPTNVTTTTGNNVVISASATGTSLTYQWFFNDVPLTDGGGITGAKSNSLNLTPVETNHSGNYFVVVTNSVAAVTSSIATLTVTVRPPVPFITSFNPIAGVVGTTVTISGGNFSANISSNIVWFGAVAAPVIAATGNELTVLVPTNATQTPISIFVNGLVCAAASPFVVTYVGAGNFSASSLAPSTSFPAGNTPIGVKIVDLDGDGKSDLVVANNTENTISVYRNIGTNGSLTLGSFAPRINFAVGASPRHVTIGDIDGDGKRDIVVANNGGSTVSVFRNISTPGDFTVNSLAPKVDFSTGTNPNQLALVDLNGDGKLDLATANSGTSTLSIFRNTASVGNITASSFAARVDFPASTQSGGLAAADIDGDGKPDLALSNLGGNSISLFRNTTPVGNAAITLATKVDFATPGNPFGGMSIGDLDGDGKLDIAVATYNGGTVSVFRNISTTGVITTNSLAARFDLATGGSTHGVVTVDIDGDGKSDLVAVSEYANAVAVFRNLSTNGTLVAGSFAPRIDFATASNPGGVAVGDLDGDGRPDVVAAASYGNVLSIFKNQNIPVPPAPPGITSQPTNQTVAVGATVLLQVVATGTQPFTYQWFFENSPLSNGGRISGATSDALAIATVQTNDIGNYFVVISNSVGSVTSAVAVLNIGVPPTISSSPVSQTNLVSSNVTFAVIADGTAPLNYQWRFNGANLSDSARVSGSTNSTLTISNLANADAGNYDVIVMNPVGSVTSVVAVLTVLQPPTFTVQPVGRSIVLGLPTTFSASVIGTAPLSYQWQFNGVDILDATNTIYSISSVAATNLGIYRLVASNVVDVSTSTEAPLTFGKIVAWGRNDFGQTVVPPNLTNVMMLAAGGIGFNPGHSLALRTDGSVIAWGNNSFGQTNVPAGLTNVVAIAAGGTHSMALRSDGKVFAWGNNGNGQTTVPSLSNIVAIAAGALHSMALRSDGKIFAWGFNSYGQTTVASFPANFTSIACGQYHSLAIRSDGALVTWGYSSYGLTNPPAGVSDLVGIAGGNLHSLALRSNGTTLSWGYYAATNVPANLTNASMVTAGDDYSAALRSNGTVAVWGVNSYGLTNVPAAVSNLVSISGGSKHLLGLIGDDAPLIIQQPIGGVNFLGRDAILKGKAIGASPLSYQWRFNGVDIPDATNATLNFTNLAASNAGDYQLVVSNAFGVATSVPAPLTILDNFALTILAQPPGIQTNYQGSKVTLNFSVAGNGPLKYQWRFNGTNISGATNQDFVFDPILFAKAGSYSAIISNQFASVTSSTLTQRVQTIRTWGYNGDYYYYSVNPPLVTNAVSVAAGSLHFLALRSDGKIEGWGTSQFGETTAPAALSNATVIAIAAGYNTSLALRSDGTPFAWGYNYYGQTNVPASAINVTAIASGPYHSLALRADGTPVAWGQNTYGQTNVPITATNLIAIAAGQYVSLGLRANGTMTSWGYSAYGLTTIPQNATNIIAIAAGATHNLALRTNGTIIAWGDNSRGQTNIPAGLSNVVAISASGGHSTALRSDGTVVYWGSYSGQTSSSATAPSDLANFIQIADGGDRSVGLLGTRAPAITIQPFGRYVFKGSNTVFVAKAVGAQPVSYQWLFNGAVIPGATNDALTLTNLQFGESGAYQLSVSNSYGIIASKPAKLVVFLPIGESLDTISLTWTSTGAAQWFGQPDVTHDGVDAARSGSVGNSQESVLQTLLSGPAQISFWWKVSSEAVFDVLEFRVDGVVQATISGETDWQQQTFSLPFTPNAHVLQWRYVKDSSSSVGQDAGFMDQFVYTPNPPVITVQPIDKTVNMGSNVQFNVSISGVGPFTYQWRKDVTNAVGINSSILTLNNVGRAQRGVYSVIVTNAGGSVTSSNALLNVLVPQFLGTPSIQFDGSLLFVSRDADGNPLSAADLANMQIQASTNLTEWSTLPGGLTLTNGNLQFQDVDATNLPTRFYRIVETP
ncbi:MAG: immunoglobulin domain-containing protein [Verrucomicrobiota bacterium]